MTRLRSSRLAAAAALVALAATAACAGETAEQPRATAVTATPGKAEPRPGGRVHEVDMVTDGDGNYFAPRDFEVRQGDVIRWRLKTGVHNARFITDSAPGVNLPEPTALLQLPGQTYDTLIEMEPGRYFYHCDPHALIGMVGYVTVVAP